MAPGPVQRCQAQSYPAHQGLFSLDLKPLPLHILWWAKLVCNYLIFLYRAPDSLNQLSIDESFRTSFNLTPTLSPSFHPTTPSSSDYMRALAPLVQIWPPASTSQLCWVEAERTQKWKESNHSSPKSVRVRKFSCMPHLFMVLHM